MSKIKYNAYFLFRKNLVEESKSNNYEDAVMEWTFVKYEEDLNECICGKKINKLYYIENKKGDRVIVGDTCIGNFLKDNIGLYKELKEIKNKISKNASYQVRAKFALFTKVINSKAYDMFMNLRSKRKYKSEKQKKYFDNIKNIIDKKWTKRYEKKKQFVKFINSSIIEEEEPKDILFVDDD